MCEALGIEHCLALLKSPQANGVAEGFNARGLQFLSTRRFESGENLARYV